MLRALKAFATILAILFGILFQSALAITIPTVRIGNPGNQADVRYIDTAHPIGVGNVGQSFNIGKTEVTNSQYVAFLNSVAKSDPYSLYSSNMGANSIGGIVQSGSSPNFSYSVKAAALGGTYTYDNKPVVYVNWGDAARFANWLHNGQPTGIEDASTTEDGAYTLNGATAITALSAVIRNANASWYIPTEDEWYKAAYYNPGTSNYYDYATRTNSAPDNNLPINDTGNSANFISGGNYTTGNGSFPLTDGGAYALSGSPYATSDQAGNVAEWNDAISPSTFRRTRGGYYGASSSHFIASYYVDQSVDLQSQEIGFRVAASIPNLPGDYSGNNIVDAADYIIGRKQSGKSFQLVNEVYQTTPGRVTQEDYIAWRGRFGNTLISGSASAMAVPEPSAWLIFIAAILCAFGAGPRLRVERHRYCVAVVSSCRETSD